MDIYRPSSEARPNDFPHHMVRAARQQYTIVCVWPQQEHNANWGRIGRISAAAILDPATDRIRDHVLVGLGADGRLEYCCVARAPDEVSRETQRYTAQRKPGLTRLISQIVE